MSKYQDEVNPLIAYLPEGADISEYMHAQGFDFLIKYPDEGDEDLEIEEWDPEDVDGYAYMGRWHSEDGLIAYYVRPRTDWSRFLLLNSLLYAWNKDESKGTILEKIINALL